MISRRLFLTISGAAILPPRVSYSADNVPSLLDHILLGCNELAHGIDLIEERTGVRAAFESIRAAAHATLSCRSANAGIWRSSRPIPNRATFNRAVQQLTTIKELSTPRLVGWAAHPGNIEAFGKKLRESGIAIQGPWPQSRARDDGRVLNWKSLSIGDDRHGLLPFFIEWDAKSLHPSVDAPVGCHLERFAVADTDPGELSKMFQRLGIDAPVERGDRPELRARISGPRGKFDLSS